MGIKGEHVLLEGIQEHHLDVIQKWSNNAEITYFMTMGMKPDSGVIYSSWDSVKEEFEQLKKSRNDVVFGIFHKQRLIGITGLYNIAWIPRNAELRIVIGKEKLLGKGLGTKAVKLLVKYGFEKLNLHRIYLGCNASDERANKCYRNAGFSLEGMFRDNSFRNGVYYDANRYSIINTTDGKKDG
jgi:RimJ/RimL family protein N-acetyltransferase